MTKQLREVVQAIYELTVNPGSKPSNWENLAEEVQLAITSEDSEHLYSLLSLNSTYCVHVDDPEAKPISSSIKNLNNQQNTKMLQFK